MCVVTDRVQRTIVKLEVDYILIMLYVYRSIRSCIHTYVRYIIYVLVGMLIQVLYNKMD